MARQHGQREYVFTVEVAAGPPNSVFRHTKVQHWTCCSFGPSAWYGPCAWHMSQLLRFHKHIAFAAQVRSISKLRLTFCTLVVLVLRPQHMLTWARSGPCSSRLQMAAMLLVSEGVHP